MRDGVRMHERMGERRGEDARDGVRMQVAGAGDKLW